MRQDVGPGRAGAGVGLGTLVAAVVIGLATAWFVVTVDGLDGAMRSLVMALPFGLAAGACAIVRYEWFIVGLLAIRSLLDVFDSGWQGGGALDPSSAVAVLVIVTGIAWIGAQWSGGALVAPAAPTIALWAVVLAGLASVAVSSDVAGSLEWNIRLIAGVVVFTVLEQLLAQRPSFVRPLLIAVIASAVIPVLVAYTQAASGGGTVAADGASRIRSTFTHPNPFGTYLVTVLLLCIALATAFDGGRRAFLWGMSIATGVALVLTQARGAWLAAVLGILILGLKLERRLLWGLVAAIMAAVVLAPSAVSRVQDLTRERYTGTAPSNSLEWRLGYWGDLVDSADGSTRLTGIGLEEVQRTASEQLQPHNVFVQTYVELGAFGVAALVALIGTMGVHLISRTRTVRTPADSAVAWAACAIAAALLLQFLSENLLTNVAAYWYAGAAMAYGYAGGGLGDTESGYKGVTRAADGRRA
jgi:putative inorganic carbon (HCO3(-)) transporter